MASPSTTDVLPSEDASPPPTMTTTTPTSTSTTGPTSTPPTTPSMPLTPAVLEAVAAAAPSPWPPAPNRRVTVGDGDDSGVSDPSSAAAAAAAPVPVYRLGEKVSHSMGKFLDARGWRRYDDGGGGGGVFNLFWKDGRFPKVVHRNLLTTQVLNKFEDTGGLSHKDRLAGNLERMRQLYDDSGDGGSRLYDFAPRSCRLCDAMRLFFRFHFFFFLSFIVLIVLESSKRCTCTLL